MKSYHNAQYARLTEKGKPKPPLAQRRAQGEAYRAAIMRFGAPEPEAAPEPVVQEAAKRGGRFRVEPRVYGRGGAIVVRHFRAGGDGPERTFIPVGSVRVYTDADGYTRVDIIESADPDIAAYLNYDTDAHTDANPDRDAVPDVDAAADVDAAPDADGDGDVDAGGDANNPISRHRAARRAERAYFDNPARLAGLPRTPGACTFVWRDAPGAEGS